MTRHAGGESRLVGTDPFPVLESEIAAGGDEGRWVGCFGHAARPDLPAQTRSSALPDAVWMHARNVHVIEHAAVATPSPAGTAGATDVAVPAEYATAFEAVQEHLRAGNTYEANLTHRHQVCPDIAPVDAHRCLRMLNPAPYAGFIQHRGTWLLSSSPERYATIGADRVIETRPVKGTNPRGATPAEDERLRHLLRVDEKFRAENLMIVDLLRNDLGMVCDVGTVEVPADLMTVEPCSSVHQLVSTVRGAASR